MGHVHGLLRMLSQKEMDSIHGAALRVLEETGMWIDSDDARGFFKQAGCQVNDASKVVRFPRKVVEDAVSLMRAKYADDSDGEVWANVRYSRTYFTNRPHRLHTDFTANAGGFPPFILDIEGGRRKATMEDVVDSIKLADALPNIDMTGLPVSAQEIPHDERPIRMTAQLLKGTAKLGGIEAWNKRDIHAIAEMCDVVTGSREASLTNPRIMGYAETRSPLCFDANMSDIFIEYIRLGFPQSVDTMPCAGTTAPASSVGAIVVGLAETLSCLVLGFTVSPDVRLSIDINPSLADMKTLVFPYASPDRMAQMAGWTQMLHEYYGVPSGIHAG
ncbi:MAG: trimethylamine methyltransferase family protein, partial [Planctomycetota bacterium]